MVLDKIQRPNDVKELKEQELPILADEIRQFIIDKVSDNGGHLASNLGVVELTIALHRCLNFPQDKLIWDVGHQSYTHKILTGRKNGFDSLRKYHGMSGFPKRDESNCDAFDTGHSSTSLSAGLGMVCARELKKEKYKVVSVIGDGSLTGGLAFEALNNAASLKSNYIMILNDNHMSISENVGGLSHYLAGVRTAKGYTNFKKNVKASLSKMNAIGEELERNIRRAKSMLKQVFIPGMFFEDMGITYLGPIDGHNIEALTEVIEDAKQVEGAQVDQITDANGLQAVKVTFDSGILFGFNSSQLSASAKNSLTDFAQVLKNNPTMDIAVYGHTDKVGTLAANEKVSLARAQAVQNYLEQKGVSARQFKSVEGKAYNDYDEAKSAAENRRVEIYMYASEQMIKDAEAGR